MLRYVVRRCNIADVLDVRRESERKKCAFSIDFYDASERFVVVAIMMDYYLKCVCHMSG